MWLWLNGFGISAVVLWIWFRISNRHVLRLCRYIPSAQPCYPVLGNALSFACSIEKLTQNVFQIVEEAVLKNHRAVCCWIGAHPIVLITNPDDIKKVFNSSISRGIEVESSGSLFMKYGLLTAPVDHWKVTRPHLNVTFKTHNLEKLMQNFNITSKNLVAALSDHVDGPQFNIWPLVMHAASMSISFFVYGSKPNYVLKDVDFLDHKHGVELGGELMALRIMKPWLMNDFIFQIFYGEKVKKFQSACFDHIRIARLASNDDQITDEDADSNDLDELKTILNSMRSLQKQALSIKEEHVKDEITSFFAAGTDTIGTTVSSCLLALACFPQIQEKLFKEICSVVEDNEDIYKDDLSRLTYLNQVIHETLRFFSVIFMIPRAPKKDIHLGGFTLPANKTSYLCVSAVGFDPKYFPEPHNFDPEHFSADKRTMEGIFMPFGRGPRSCIGKEYAMILIKVMVAHVVRNYRLSTTMDIQTQKKKFMITTTLCDGYNVLIKKRSKSSCMQGHED